MRLKYNNDSIMVTFTNNIKILSYKFQKLYYAIIINDCSRYSSILNKQKVDVFMVDENLKVLSIKRGMHENTVFQFKNANKVIILPLGSFGDIKIGDQLKVEVE